MLVKCLKHRIISLLFVKNNIILKEKRLTMQIQCVTIKQMEVMLMAKTDTLNIRIEPKLKKEVEATLEDLGMNIADAVTIFLKQVVMTESIPFMIKKPKLNQETVKAIEDAENGINLSKGYTDLDEMWEDLEKED